MPPIAALVASGFEHGVANTYIVPSGILVEGESADLASTGGLPDLADLIWASSSTTCSR